MCFPPLSSPAPASSLSPFFILRSFLSALPSLVWSSIWVPFLSPFLNHLHAHPKKILQLVIAEPAPVSSLISLSCNVSSFPSLPILLFPSFPLHASSGAWPFTAFPPRPSFDLRFCFGLISALATHACMLGRQPHLKISWKDRVQMSSCAAHKARRVRMTLSLPSSVDVPAL